MTSANLVYEIFNFVQLIFLEISSNTIKTLLIEQTSSFKNKFEKKIVSIWQVEGLAVILHIWIHNPKTKPKIK